MNLGCSPRRLDDGGYPARAGIEPRNVRIKQQGRLPRARGDEPDPEDPRGAVEQYSPRVRGWTQAENVALEAEVGIPARAGMDPGNMRLVASCGGAT